MILYFSGTGNSHYVARVIGNIIDDQLISINDRIKNKDYRDINSDKPLVIVCPTYGWRIPRVVEEYIRRINFIGNKQVYYIMTCGDSTMNAIKYIKILLEDKKFVLKGFKEIVMPENYIAMFTVPNKKKALAIIDKSKKEIFDLARRIKNNENLDEFKGRGSLYSGIINKIFYKFLVKDKGFYVKDNCIACNKCSDICPLNNIELKNKKPEWKNNCTHCMACISICPVNAIEYKKKSINQPRFYIKDIEGTRAILKDNK